MFRILLVVAAVMGLWFGYDSLAGSSAKMPVVGEVETGGELGGTQPATPAAPPTAREADPAPAAVELAPAGVDPGPREAEPGPPAAAIPEPSTAPLAMSGELPTEAHGALGMESLLEALRAGRLADAGAAFPTLRRTSGPDRDRLTAAIRQAAGRAEPEQIVKMFGRRNAFLHCDLGREVAKHALLKLSKQAHQPAVATLTRMIEAAMRGPVEPGDTAALAIIDATYGALQRPLRRTVLNPAHLSRARSHEVQPGEVLDRIARRFRGEGLKLGSGTIAAFNRITDPRSMRAGQVLKIPVDPIHAVVEKRSYLMALYVGDVIFRLYRVGHGKDDCTPEETFRVISLHEKPDWYAPGGVVPYGHPDNVLGDYFVKFEHPSFVGFGAHGTAAPETIGTMASAGCLRMLDADIEDFFRIIPVGAKIEIRASE